MKNSFHKVNEESFLNQKLRTSYLISFFVLGLLPAVPFSVKPYLLSPLFITSLINLIYKKNTEINYKKIVISSGVFLVFLLSSLYSTDLNQAIEILIRLLPFLILPFSFSFVPKRYYQQNFIIFKKTYIFSSFLFCFLIFFYSISLGVNDLPYIFSYISNEFWGFNDHPIYISLSLGVALILIAFSREINYIRILQFSVILFTILFLSRKGNIINLTVIFIAILILKRIHFKKFLSYLIILLVILLILAYMFDNYIFIRFYEGLNLSQAFNELNSSTGIRTILWRESLLLSFESPFIGYGLGDVQNHINTSLIENGYEALTIIHSYNSHNQFLQIILSSGYLGLLIIMSIFIFLFQTFKNRKNKISFYIFLYIISCFMFESLLERQNGIIITALFFNLMLFLPIKNKE